jgi:hypothetical protein
MRSSPGPSSASDALLWPLQPGAFPGARLPWERRFARCARCCERRRYALRPPPRPPTPATPPTPARDRSRADAATSAVLAALPSGAKTCLRLSCRAGRAGVDAHARRLEVNQGHALVSPAAAARMPLLQELEVWAHNDAQTRALAAGLRALARGPARLRRATVLAEGGGSALGGLVSALSCLTALTRLELTVDLLDSPWAAPPLVLPWARIEVRGRGRGPRAGLPAGVLLRLKGGGNMASHPALWMLRRALACSARVAFFARLLSARPPSLSSRRRSCCFQNGPPPRVRRSWT